MPMDNRLMRPMVSGFNPLKLSGLSAWYDASVSSSITLTNGFVSQWSDLSGQGHHLTQSVEADRPGTATVNGRTAIDFDGTSDYLSNAAAPPGFTYGTIFCVHNTDTGGSRAIYGVCGSANQMMAASRHTTAGEYRNNAGNGGTVNRSGGVNTLGATKLISQTFDSATSAHAVRIDGVVLNGTTGGFFSNVAGTWLGVRNSNTLGFGLWYDGKIGEWVIYNRVLSATEIARVESYLAKKWGVTLS